jgi:hypothetical protein
MGIQKLSFLKNMRLKMHNPTVSVWCRSANYWQALFLWKSFSPSGDGNLIMNAIENRNYPLSNCILIIAIWFVSANLLADILITSLTPDTASKGDR